MLDLCSTSYFNPTNFKVTISKKNYPYLAFNAQQINHPAMDVNAVDAGYKRAVVPFTGDRVEFGAVSMEVILDEDLKAYGEIYNWMERNLETKHNLNSGVLYNQGSTELSDYNDIRIQMLTNKNNANREFVYRNAFPVSLGDIAFNSTEEATFITCNVSFRFDYFEFL